MPCLREGERDWVADLAQFTALAYQSVPGLDWAGGLAAVVAVLAAAIDRA